MKKQELYNRVMAYMREAIPVAETELHYRNPYELLVAVILSAQCTDKRVNLITPALFEAYPTPEVMAAATPEAVFEYAHWRNWSSSPAWDGRLPTSSRRWCSTKPPWRSTPMSSV